MILTKQLIEAGRTPAGAFRASQLKALGLQWEGSVYPEKGWPSRLIGMEVTDEQYQEFLRLRQKSQKQRAEKPQPNPDYIRVSFVQGSTIRELCKMFGKTQDEIQELLRYAIQTQHDQLVEERSKHRV